MFGKKSKLERVKADAKADYLKCSALDPEDRLHRVFAARIAQRARLNLDKIFVQGAKAEEKRQHEMAEAIKAGSVIPPRIVHEGYNQLQGISGSVVSWVPEELANKMFNLGADYQITEVSAHEALQQAEKVAETIIEDLQTTQSIQLLGLLREDDGDDESED
ncbi:MAG: hypothetical protein CME57_03870 [Halieaceae bacterium]|nr:hypothetical protein [Halieaceae bacterium]